MDRRAIAPAFEMGGAFNDVVVRLQPGASDLNVRADLDRLLTPYGSTGAVPRAKQISNYILEGEMGQLRVFATVAPAIFLGVAAFLLNVVLARLVSLQRPQIAALKAVGYNDWIIGLHFLFLVTVIVVIGAIIGIAAGSWMGREMTDLYTQFFRFPLLAYRLDARTVFVGIFVSVVAAVFGALLTVRRVAKLPPAEAMRPEPPARYRRTVLDRIGVGRLVGPAGRMIMREVERRPIRLVLSVFGISMAVAICVLGRFMDDAVDHLMNVQFHESMREDVTVGFIEPVPRRSIRGLAHLPGVLHAEGMRMANVRFRHGNRYRDAAIYGYPDQMELRRVLDKDGVRHDIPRDGIMLTRTLGDVLGLRVGDMVDIEVREGDRHHGRVRVSSFIDESFGLQGHLPEQDLARLLREHDTVSIALLRIDPDHYEDIQGRLKNMPTVSTVLSKQTILRQFHEQTADWLNVMVIIMTALGSVIAIGVVYNNARIALSMRARDLASLRVLGFTRREISGILLGELAIQVLLAIPPGLMIGAWLAEGMMATNDPEQYRFPVVLSTQTYAYAALVTLASGLVSALLVRRKLDRLDLIAVLKTRE
jgi:putative ABC transport system permease protein